MEGLKVLISRGLFFSFGAIFGHHFSHFGEFLISTHVIQAREMVA
jgi:hypothetical protein